MLVLGIVGAVLIYLDFSVATVLLGFVLGPMMEQNFRRALLLSHGDLFTFVEHPISAGFIAATALLIAAQILVFIWKGKRKTLEQPA